MTQTTCVHRYVKSGELLQHPNIYEAICCDCGKVLAGGWTPPEGLEAERLSDMLAEKLVEKGIRYGKY